MRPANCGRIDCPLRTTSEGRAQRQYQVFVPEGDVREGWRWLGAILGASGRREASHWRDFDAAASAVAREQRAFARLPEASEPATERIAGARIARAPHRYSGRTAFRLRQGVLETEPPADPDSPLSFSMEGSPGVPPGRITPHFRVAGWNSVQSLTRFVEEINGPLRGGDPGVRLVEPAAGAPSYTRAEVPGVPEGTLRIVPRHHIFGSEELSALSPGVRELSPPPYIELHPDDAARLGATADRPVELRAGDVALNRPVRIDAGRARGTAGVPAGIPEIPVSPPSWGEVRAS